MSKRTTTIVKPQHRRKPDQAVLSETITSNQAAAFLPWKAPFVADGVSVRDATGRAVCLCATASSPLNVRQAAATRIAAALNAQE